MSGNALAQFVGQKYLSLETLRKNGSAVRTPVWFAEAGGIFYLYSLADAGKVKRIRNNPHVRMAPSDIRGKIHGEWVPARARILDGDEALRADNLLNKKYGAMKKIGDIFAKFRPRKRAFLAISLDASV
jgi:PPOX class probable F420-dependent enzyme